MGTLICSQRSRGNEALWKPRMYLTAPGVLELQGQTKTIDAASPGPIHPVTGWKEHRFLNNHLLAIESADDDYFSNAYDCRRVILAGLWGLPRHVRRRVPSYCHVCASPLHHQPKWSTARARISSHYSHWLRLGLHLCIFIHGEQPQVAEPVAPCTATKYSHCLGK